MLAYIDNKDLVLCKISYDQDVIINKLNKLLILR